MRAVLCDRLVPGVLLLILSIECPWFGDRQPQTNAKMDQYIEENNNKLAELRLNGGEGPIVKVDPKLRILRSIYLNTFPLIPYIFIYQESITYV